MAARGEKTMKKAKRKWYQKIYRFGHAVLCLFGKHGKKYDVGGYRCLWCGRYVEGYRIKEGK